MIALYLDAEPPERLEFPACVMGTLVFNRFRWTFAEEA